MNDTDTIPCPRMNRERALAAAFLILAAALVAGQRFGLRFAGGSGYEAPLVATADGAEYRRGETVRSEDRVFTLNVADLGYVDLQPHAELTIERLTKDEVVLRLGAGAFTVTANALPFEIRMDVLEASVHGAAGFEHVPAKRLVRVSPIGGAIFAARRGETRTPVTEPSVLFYDRADRETIDNPPKNP